MRLHRTFAPPFSVNHASPLMCAQVESAELERALAAKTEAGIGGAGVQAVRAPLVTAVLGGYHLVGPAAWRQELREIFPHLARLICSSQPSVRSALAQLLQAQLPPLIAEL